MSKKGTIIGYSENFLIVERPENGPYNRCFNLKQNDIDDNDTISIALDELDELIELLKTIQKREVFLTQKLKNC
jgi:hypothetical protein